MNKTRRIGLGFKTLVVSAAALGLGAVASGCITRPIAPNEPTTKTNFTAVVRQAAIDKIDFLFAIDNSASMGDKQELLKEAVPDLITRLLQPDCVDENDVTVYRGSSTQGPNGDAVCPAGSKPEFPPVHDMHIGVISSSLGSRGGSACPDSDQGRHNNDRAHLLNRATATETVIGQATPSNFLAWLPSVEKNASKSRDPSQVGATPFGSGQQDAFVKNFQDLIIGVKENGCGYEAQLESMYRFLVQPDPYAQLVKNGEEIQYDGVDFELLKQRRDFLRPDSLLAVIMVTDENESTVAPRAFGGRAWFFADQDQRMKPGTQICETNPSSPDCMSCYLTPAGNDPRCKEVPQLPEAEDHPNVRFWHMKRRFGIDPRYPIDRYVRGLRERRVPSSQEEYEGFNYVGSERASCQNPIFAANLPAAPGEQLCDLRAGPRTSDLVYFAIIGGVPWQFLTEDPDNLSASYANRVFKDRLSAQDWTRLLGVDPFAYDFSGQHPLMQESREARPGANPSEAHDREWQTNGKDLQYACTFELPSPKDCNQAALAPFCDCAEPTDSPLCGANNQQLRGKAYPTISQLAVAKALGEQAIVASICPPDPKNKELGGQANRYYGYRPAVRAIIDRLKNSLASQCLPEKLSQDDTGNVPCLVLQTFREGGVSCAEKGLTNPDPAILQRFLEQQRVELGDDLKGAVVCETPQILPNEFVGNSCEKTEKAGWCYLTGAAAGGTCPQAIKFSELGNPVGATVSLQCIRSTEGQTEQPAETPQ